mmetsp:Transcript_49342/g.143012  ORF Transcript_49342/g.143012 Transcript_49342/m.143012 type:complete len:214 (+) Transcript_49342:412-1053(+)
MMVEARPPFLTTSRAISVRPRAMSPARALAPKWSPSLAPEAMARTFLMAPQSSAPRTSEAVYTRKWRVERASWTFAHTSGFSDAQVTFVGKPMATSLAKDGPEMTHSILWYFPGSSSSRISKGVRSVSVSMPLLQHTNGTPVGSCVWCSTTHRPMNGVGMTRRISSAFFTASPTSFVAVTRSLSATPGRNAAFSCRSLTPVHTSGSMAHRATL